MQYIMPPTESDNFLSDFFSKLLSAAFTTLKAKEGSPPNSAYQKVFPIRKNLRASVSETRGTSIFPLYATALSETITIAFDLAATLAMQTVILLLRCYTAAHSCNSDQTITRRPRIPAL